MASGSDPGVQGLERRLLEIESRFGTARLAVGSAGFAGQASDAPAEAPGHLGTTWEAGKNRTITALSGELERTKQRLAELTPGRNRGPFAGAIAAFKPSASPEPAVLIPPLVRPRDVADAEPVTYYPAEEGTPGASAFSASSSSAGRRDAFSLVDITNDASASAAAGGQRSARVLPGAPKSTWEYSKNRGLLALEAELKKAQQQLREREDVEDRWRERVAEMLRLHARQLQAAPGELSVQLSRMRNRAADAQYRASFRARVVQALRAWQAAAVQTSRLKQALRVWRHRQLESLMLGWQLQAQRSRHARQQAAALKRRHDNLVRRFRTKSLLHAWAQAAAAQVHERQQWQRAVRHSTTMLQARCLAALRRRTEVAKHQEARLRAKTAATLLRHCLLAWHRHARLCSRLDNLHGRHLMLQALRTWSANAAYSATILRAEATVAEAVCTRTLRDGLAQWRAAARLQRVERQLPAWRDRRLSAAALAAWHRAAQQQARERRIVTCRAVQRSTALRDACFSQWLRLCRGSRLRRVEDDNGLLQAELLEAQHAAEAARQEAGASAEALRATRDANAALQVEAVNGPLLSPSSGLLGYDLRWRGLLPQPGAWSPPPRSRLSAFLLSGLQAQQQPVTPGDPSAVVASTTLVTFGGVAADLSWTTEVNVLTVSITQDGGARFSWQRPRVDSGLLAVPARRDHAAVAVGPNQFLVMGGFDGSSELADMQLVTVVQGDDGQASPSQQRQQREGESSAASAGSSGGGGWRVTCTVVAPRNRSPTARSHHSLACHHAGRSLFLFGGYSSASGFLNDVWAFHMDHQEWWQPEAKPGGPWPPPRRDHASAIFGNRLFIHGGFDGQQHLGDTWVLDLNTWTWAQLAASGDAPTPRRGHAAEPLGDRFWLLHGGYDGEQQLGDARLLDVTTGSWSRLAVAGGPEEWPVPRALHTLTHVGHMLVLLGGATPLGPAGDVHLLVNGALLQGMVQNQRVLSTVQRLAGSEARAARLAAEAATAKSSEEKALQQVAALKQRAAHVVSSYNSAVADVEALKDALQREHREAAAANSAARAATQKAATLARRLARAKEGGGEVAAAARELWEQLQQAELQQAQLQRQLQLRVHVGVELADARAQNQALEAQLEQVEAHYLRQLQERDERIAKLEQQQQAAPAATPGPSSPDRGGAAAPSASPSRRTTATPLFSRPGSSAEVAVQYARAEAAERQFIGLQDDVCKLQARVAQLQVEAERERRSAQGSEQTAQAAVAQLRELESGYQQQLEAVAQQLAASRQQCYRLEAELAARAATAAAAAVPVDVPSAALAGPRQQPAISTAAAAAAPQVSAGSPNRAPAATAGGVVSLTTIDGLDYAAPDFTVTYQQQQQQQQTAEGLQVGGERSTLEVLPEVAKLLQLHRTLIGEQP